MGLYIIQGTEPKGAKIWKTSLKIGMTTTSKVNNIHMSWSKQNYIVINWRCKFVLKLRQSTLLRRNILNRLYRAYQYPHRYESISNCLSKHWYEHCTEINGIYVIWVSGKQRNLASLPRRSHRRLSYRRHPMPSNLATVVPAFRLPSSRGESFGNDCTKTS